MSFISLKVGVLDKDPVIVRREFQAFSIIFSRLFGSPDYVARFGDV